MEIVERVIDTIYEFVIKKKKNVKNWNVCVGNSRINNKIVVPDADHCYIDFR